MKKRRGYIIAAVVAAVFLGVVGVRQYMNYLAQPLDEVEVTDSAEVDNIVRKYGIPVSEYQINYGIVEPGQNLSVILRKHGLSLTEVHQLTEKTKGVFDVRKIRDGTGRRMRSSPQRTASRKKRISSTKKARSRTSFSICVTAFK